jgi:cupin 2 domain-containing protein
MAPLVRGRLAAASDAPAVGERNEILARIGNAVVEQILSGSLPSPVTYDQGHDEWVVLLAGSAVLEVDGQRIEMSGGDWLLLPAHVPHRLIETRPETSWLAVHDPDGS